MPQDVGTYREPWAVYNDEVLPLIPPEGFVADYMDYVQGCTDAPLWFQLGSVLTTLLAAAGKWELQIGTDQGSYRENLQLWSMIVGDSGSRKTQAMKLCRSLLARAAPQHVMPVDGTQEAWHTYLAEPDTAGIGIFYHDEMAFLLDSARKSYLTGLGSWLLSTYDGGPLDRKTMAGGRITIARVRVSILGGIPPDTLLKKTTTSDWRSGFMPRMTIWASDRATYRRYRSSNPDVETMLSHWLQTLNESDRGLVYLPHTLTAYIADWVEAEVEARRREYPNEIFSCLGRLQDKISRIAAALALARQRHPIEEVVHIDASDVEGALQIGGLLKRSLLELFGIVVGSEDRQEESTIEAYLRGHPGASCPEIAKNTNLSKRKARATLDTLMKVGEVVQRPGPSSSKGGRPPLLYFWGE